MEGPVKILLEDRRVERMERVDLVGNAGAAVSLLWSAFHGLPARDLEGTVLGVVEVIVGGVLLVTVARELRASVRGAPSHEDGTEPTVNRVSILVAAVLFAETYQRVYQGGRFPGPTFLTGLAMLGLGIFHRTVERRKRDRRSIVVDHQEVRYRGSRFRGFRVPWAELSALEIDPATVTLTTRGGKRHRINLRRYHNADEVVHVLSEFAAAKGVPVTGAGAPATPPVSIPAH